ncbi:MAG: hypothetical protein K8T25_05535 [Planctomycetia bacterium]|nr:hypothetical protein [Planctomycetia bacterium]
MQSLINDADSGEQPAGPGPSETVPAEQLALFSEAPIKEAAGCDEASQREQDALREQLAQREAEVAQLKEQVTHMQRLTALGELVSTTTHEYNNVLMTVINYAKIGMRHKDQATRDKSFEKILAAGNRAARITNSILGLARNRSADFEPTDLARLIDDALVLLEREMSKYRVSVERRIEPAPLAMVNGNQIQQVLLNLLVNARQAMPNGGRVILKLTHDTQHNTVDTLHLSRHHRSPSRQNPSGQHPGQGDRVYAETARSSRTGCETAGHCFARHDAARRGDAAVVSCSVGACTHES